MRNLIFYAGISFPLQQPKADLCAGNNEVIKKNLLLFQAGQDGYESDIARRPDGPALEVNILGSDWHIAANN